MQAFDYKDLPEHTNECGAIRVSFTEGAGFARAIMVEGVAKAHYHLKTTKYYIVLEGTGVVRISSGKEVNEVELKPGVVVRFDVNEVHQTKNLGGLVVETITIPAWTQEDELFSEVNLFA